MITGTILNIEPTQEGGYQSRNGYIYTFWMAIETPNGPLSGEIGSKTELYPVPVGKEITVNVTNDTQRGVKFKKINPQYEAQRPQNTQQGGQQPRQGANAPKRDYDKENRGKCRNKLYAACIITGITPEDLSANRITLMAIEGLVEKSMNGIGPITPNQLPPGNQPINPPVEEDIPWENG